MNQHILNNWTDYIIHNQLFLIKTMIANIHSRNANYEILVVYYAYNSEIHKVTVEGKYIVLTNAK